MAGQEVSLTRKIKENAIVVAGELIAMVIGYIIMFGLVRHKAFVHAFQPTARLEAKF